MSDYPDDYPPFQEEPYGASDFDIAARRADAEAEHERYLQDAKDWYEEPFDEIERFDPATEVVEIIDIDTVITLDGRVLVLEIRIFADEHTEDHQYYLEDTCDPPPHILDDLPF